MRWTLVLVACACLGLFLATGRAEAQQPPGAPTIGSVTAGTNTLTVSWSAPAESGGTPITAYDLQYIRTDDDETDPANWTLLDNAWTTTTGGTLQRVVGDLLDGLSYDLQVRAHNSEGPGDWSDTHAASTNDHDPATSDSSLVALGSSLPGYIASGDDDDTFRISVPPGGGYLWVYTTGEVDTNGVFAAGNREIFDRNEDGWLPHGVRNFSIRYRVYEGTYYFRVQGQRGSTGAYRVHARLGTLPGATAATAQTVTLGESALGRIQLVRHVSEDNYFTFTLTATTDVAIMASGLVDVIGELRDSGQTVLGSENGSGFLGAGGFLLRRSLPAGTYYVRVRARVYNGAGPYILLIDEAGDAGGSSSVAATPLAFGHPLVARISSDTEEDYYRFTLDAETYVRFLAQPLGDSFALEATLYDDQNTDLSAYTVDRADYARHGQPYAAGILEKLEAGTYTLRIKAPSGETGGPYLVFAQVDTGQAEIIAGCKATTDAQTNALTDPLSGCQWPVKNTNQYGGDGDDINIESVWAAGKLGAGVNIAIVDNGIHAGHEDLVDNVVAARNHDYYGFAPDALATHGTQVAGLIAARDNDIGIRGVAPRASIYVYNLTADEDKIADNEADAMTRNMADTAVSNNSWSFPDDGDLHSPTAAWEEAVERGVTEGFGGKGVFYVWAAGNGGSEDNSNLDGRANFYAVTAACATTSRNRITDHSERGSNLWVCAPAGYRFDFFEFYPLVTTTTTGHRYTRNQGGASAAAAIVSGVAALVRAENPDLTWRDVKLILAASASRNDPVHGKWERGARKYRSTSQRYSYSHNYGFGTVDAAAAVRLAAGWTKNVPPLRTVEAASGPVDTPIEDAIENDTRPGSTVSSTITLPDGYVEFIEYIEVEVTMAHPSVRDLRIVIESPSGAVSVLSTALTESQFSDERVFDGSFRFGSARHLGEDPGGTWTIRITDYLVIHSGTFASWKIKAYGHSETPGYLPTPTATSGMRTLTIDWDAPTDIGGSAVTSYDLGYIRSDASGKTDPANWTELAGIGTDDTGTYEITGLGPGVQYDVQVRAVNETGPGPWSESLVVRSSLEQPFAPSLSRVTPRNEGLGATWDAPTEDGGSEITSYDLRSIRSDATDEEKEVAANWEPTFLAWPPLDGDLQGRVAGLTNGVQYDVQVRAENAIGVSAWSETLKGTPAIQNTDASFADDTADREVAEDIAVDSNVGARVAATDPDRGDPLTYSILGGHNLFEIDAGTGQLSVKAALDADEGVTSHTLTVEVSDMLNSSDDEDPTIDDTIVVTIAVTNVNEPPLVEGTRAIDHAENAGTALANARYSATDPERANITWSLGGDDKGFFAISDSGVLSFAAEPDFDIKGDLNHDNAYEVTVQATEEDGVDPLTGSLAVTVTIADVNEPPVVRPVITGQESVTVNEGHTGEVATYAKRDPEGGASSWEEELAGADAGYFDLDELGTLRFKSPPDFEARADRGRDNVYNVIVRASDDDNLIGSLAVAVTVMDVDEPPVITGQESVTVNEGHTGEVATYAKRDPEGGASSWEEELAGADAGYFDLDELGTLRFKSPPDFEARADRGRDNVYNVIVRASDDDNLIGSLAVAVTVMDVDEPPVITGQESVTVNEGHAGELARYAKRDLDGDDLTNWARVGETAALVGADAGAFAFDKASGALSFTAPPDFEQRASYQVTLWANDGVNNAKLMITVNVTDVDEDGEVTFDRERPLLNLLLTATLEDPDGVVGAESWTWHRSTSRGGGWGQPIAGAVSNVFTPLAADRDHYLRATVAYSDTHGAKTEQAVTEFPAANIPDGNKAPDLPDSVEPISIPENTPARSNVGGPVRASDEDGDPLSYSLQGSSDFVIDSTGQITVADGVMLDFEERQTSYTLTVGVDDGFEGRDSVTVTVTVTDVNEAPEAADLAVTVAEDGTVDIDVVREASDEDAGDTLTVESVVRDPQAGTVAVDGVTNTITYTPQANYVGSDNFTYRVKDEAGLPSNSATVTITVTGVNDAPAFAAAPPPERSVSENAQPEANVGAPVTATDVDDDTLTYRLAGSADFEIDEYTGQITVAEGAALDAALSPYSVTVTADDGTGEANATAMVDVTITVTAGPPVITVFPGGGGGGGGGGPTPSELDFEWNVTRDIEELDAANDRATGVWSDGTTLWLADNADGAGDAVYAYDRESGERVESREFALAETNRAPRGFWSDRSVVWVSDSGQERLFAYRLTDGERLEEREFALAERNSDARGIWSDEETMWVIDDRNDALFAYDLDNGEVIAEYGLDSANDTPHGIWSDRVTVWVSDHGAKRLFAYRLPAPEGPAAEDAEPQDLERVRDEEFPSSVLSRASNNSPRGIWSDGDVMYVADESDDKVYSYNMPDAIDARLASLTLSGVDIGEFSPRRTEYEAVVADGVTETAVEAEALQRRTDVAIDPPDADGDDANGYQVALRDVGEITVTVTSQDGSRMKVYRVQFPETGWDPARDPWPHCLRGAVSEGLSLVVYEGGSVGELISCAESRGVAALYALHEGVYLSHILGAPGFVNRGFVATFGGGVPPVAPLVVRSDGPPSPDPFGDDLDGDGQQPWPECVRGPVAAGLSLVVYEGGSVDELEACARSREITALYALHEGVYLSYILGAPGFVNRPFRDLFADGLPLMTPLVVKSEGLPGDR